MTAVLVCVITGLGLFFLLVAALGFVRLKDVYSRLHVTCILDTMGAPLLMIAAALHLGWDLAAGKLLLGVAFLYLTSPLVGHMLSRAALASGHAAHDTPLPVWPAGSPDSEIQNTVPVTKPSDLEKQHEPVPG